jgi:Zn-dependent metalloprotease
VDAKTGKIYTTHTPFVEDYNANGTVTTWYNGQNNNIVTRSCGLCPNFWLSEEAGRRIQTRKAVSFDKIKDGDNNWTDNTDKTAASAHWALEKSFDYFTNRHGRWGTDYNGKQIKIHIDAALGGANAAWNFDNNEDNIYIRPDNANLPTTRGFSAAMLDVLAHEYTHGMVAASSQLGVTGAFDANSLNEAFADIFGIMVERNVNGVTDWTFAENMGTYQRNFQDPHQDFGMFGTNNGNASGASASRFNEPNFWSTTNFHANGGIMSVGFIF